MKLSGLIPLEILWLCTILDCERISFHSEQNKYSLNWIHYFKLHLGYNCMFRSIKKNNDRLLAFCWSSFRGFLANIFRERAIYSSKTLHWPILINYLQNFSELRSNEVLRVKKDRKTVLLYMVADKMSHLIVGYAYGIRRERAKLLLPQPSKKVWETLALPKTITFIIHPLLSKQSINSTIEQSHTLWNNKTSCNESYHYKKLLTL